MVDDMMDEEITNDEQNIEIIAIKEVNRGTKVVVDEEFRWTRQLVLMFMEWLLELKGDLKNPAKKKKSVWSQISANFKAKGHNIDWSAIERKFRNMKCTYRTIKENIAVGKTARTKVLWEYYPIMETIMAELAEEKIVVGPRISRLTPSSGSGPTITVVNTSSFLPSKSNIPLLAPAFSLQEKITPSSPSLPPLTCLLDSSSSSITSSTPNTINKEDELYLRKKQLEIEAARVDELRRLRETVQESNRIQQESNRIQQERNEILLTFLE